MKLSYRNKIAIDHTAGLLIALVLKGSSKILAVILRRDHSIPENPKRIVVAKLVGLGSIVYSGALCVSIKKRYPDTKLVYITANDGKEIVKRFSVIDEVLCVDDRDILSILTSGFNIIKNMWRFRPDLYFDLEVFSTFSAILATLSLAINRYGFYRKSATFKRNLHTHMIFYNTQSHIIDIYGQMARCVSADSKETINGVYRINDHDKNECRDYLNKLGLIDKKLIAVNVNASELLLERRWPIENWTEVLEKITKRYPEYGIMLTGSFTEHDFVEIVRETLTENSRKKVYNVAGMLSIGGFLGLINLCELLVTNDSGPLHLAVAQNKPTVSIWGPVSPDSYGPKEGIHEIIYGQTYCSPCLHHADLPPCEGDNVCMKETNPNTVFRAVERIISRKADEKYHNDKTRKNKLIKITKHKIGKFNPVMFHTK